MPSLCGNKSASLKNLVVIFTTSIKIEIGTSNSTVVYIVLPLTGVKLLETQLEVFTN